VLTATAPHKPAFDPGALISDDALAAGLAHPDRAVDESVHTLAVERVCELYRRCAREREAVPEIYRPGGEWLVYINERRALYDAILAGDTVRAGDLLRGFWRNDLGAIVKEYASYDQLVAGEQPATDRFCRNVSRNYLIWQEIVGGDPATLDIPPVGEPWGYRIGGRVIAPKATRFHTLAVQIAELVRGTLSPSVLEVGAGYGGMAFYLLRDQPDVRYVDLDLPETLVIAAYYLLCALPDRRIVIHGESDAPLHDLLGPGAPWFHAVLLPNHAFPALPDGFADVTVNTFSLSEMPRPTLEENLRQIARTTRSFFLHHNMDRAGVVNRGAERIPASTFPIGRADFRLLHRGFDLFHGHDGDYREFLYRRIGDRAC
jgi:SAM-dependent methyltransferase